MKITDLQYCNTLYNLENKVERDIGGLLYPQKYIQLELDGELYNLDIIYVDDDKFITHIDGKVREGVK